MGSVKMYKLQNTPQTHTNYLTTVLQACTLSPPDVCLITLDGHTVFTNKVLLAMNSNIMAEMMTDNVREEIVKISVPISANTLVNLVKILSHGITNSEVKFNPMEILAAAEILGISLVDLQIGKEGEEKKRNLDQISKGVIKYFIQENLSENGMVSADETESKILSEWGGNDKTIDESPHDADNDVNYELANKFVTEKEECEKNFACEYVSLDLDHLQVWEPIC